MSRSEPNSGSNARAGAQFRTTRWSAVRAAVDSAAPAAPEALEKLCRTYWFPLYAYVRRRGYDVHDAQDLTQEFFARFLEKKYLRRADQDRGKFRSFLLTSLKNFLANEWDRARAEKRGGNCAIVSLDDTAEARYGGEASSDLPPDKIFERRWALALLEEALQRLAQESAASGKAKQFELLRPFLSGETSGARYDGPAAQLGLTTNAVSVAVHRLRTRYRELVREEVAHTILNPAEIDEEMRFLLVAIGGGE